MSLKRSIRLFSTVFVLAVLVHAETPIITVDPHDVTVVAGSDVILECVVEKLPLGDDMVQWTKSGFALGFDRDLSGFPRYSMVGDESLGQYNLQILNASLGDEDEYECQVTMFMQRSEPARLTILVPPKGPKIDDVTVESRGVIDVLATNENLITCRSWNGKPAAKLEWRRDGVLIKTNVTYAETEATQKLRNSSATLRIFPTDHDDGATFECVMTVDPLFRDADPFGYVPQRTSVEINVQQPPVASLSLSSAELKEGTNLYASCDSSESKPEATSYLWFIAGRKIEGETSSSILLRDVNRTLNEVTFGCQSVNRVGNSKTSSVTLSILYAPTLISAPVNVTTNVSDTVSFSCKWKSNPPSLITWYRKTAEGKVVMVGDGEDLTVEVTDQSMAGIYICIADARGVGSKSTSARLDVLGPPLFDSANVQHVAQGSKGKVECSLSSKPEIADVIWHWEYNGEKMSLSNNETRMVYQDNQRMMKFTGEIMEGGSKAYLVILDVIEADFHDYNCTVHNAYGTASATVSLQELVKPQPMIMMGAIVGAAVGAVLLLLILAIICICCLKRRRQQKSTTFPPEEEELNKQHQVETDNRMENGFTHPPKAKLLSPDPDSDNPSTSASISSRDGARESLALDEFPPGSTHYDDGYHTEEANSWNRPEKNSPDSSPTRSSRDNYLHTHPPIMPSSNMGAFERGSPYTSSEVGSDLGNKNYLKYNMQPYESYTPNPYGPNGVVDLPPSRPRGPMSPVNMYVEQQPYPSNYNYQAPPSTTGYRAGAYPPSFAVGQQMTRTGSTTPSIISSHRSVTPSPAAYAAMLGRATPVTVLGDGVRYYSVPSQPQSDQAAASSSQSSLEMPGSSVAASDAYENAAKMSQMSSRMSQASRSSELLGNRQLTARMATNV